MDYNPRLVLPKTEVVPQHRGHPSRVRPSPSAGSLGEVSITHPFRLDPYEKGQGFIRMDERM